MKAKSIKSLSTQTKALLRRTNQAWRWSSTAYAWAGWLLKSGVSEEAIVHLATRILLGKIDNPWSMKAVSLSITQNEYEKAYSKERKKREVSQDEAPELLKDIFLKHKEGIEHVS